MVEAEAAAGAGAREHGEEEVDSGTAPPTRQ